MFLGAGIALRGPALVFLAFADYLLPLLILEIYLRAQAGSSKAAKLAAASTVSIATLAMGIGIAVASMGMWLPHMR